MVADRDHPLVLVYLLTGEIILSSSSTPSLPPPSPSATPRLPRSQQHVSKSVKANLSNFTASTVQNNHPISIPLGGQRNALKGQRTELPLSNLSGTHDWCSCHPCSLLKKEFKESRNNIELVEQFYHLRTHIHRNSAGWRLYIPWGNSSFSAATLIEDKV